MAIGSAETASSASNPCVVAELTNRVYCGDTHGRLEEHDLSNGALIRIIDAQNGNVGSLWITRRRYGAGQLCR